MLLGPTHCLLLILFISHIQTTYIFSKDFFIGYKAAEFSIFASNKPFVQYRIESDYALGQKIRLVKQSTKEVIGRLKGEWSTAPHSLRFSILNTSSEQWNNGTIKRIPDRKPTRYIIKWDNSIFWMKSQINGTMAFENEDENVTLATFKRIRGSFTESKRYQLWIFSNVVPEPIFFLALAVEDAYRSVSRRG